MRFVRGRVPRDPVQYSNLSRIIPGRPQAAWIDAWFSMATSQASCQVHGVSSHDRRGARQALQPRASPRGGRAESSVFGVQTWHPSSLASAGHRAWTRRVAVSRRLSSFICDDNGRYVLPPETPFLLLEAEHSMAAVSRTALPMVPLSLSSLVGC